MGVFGVQAHAAHIGEQQSFHPVVSFFWDAIMNVFSKRSFCHPPLAQEKLRQIDAREEQDVAKAATNHVRSRERFLSCSMQRPKRSSHETFAAQPHERFLCMSCVSNVLPSRCFRSSLCKAGRALGPRSKMFRPWPDRCRRTKRSERARLAGCGWRAGV